MTCKNIRGSKGGRGVSSVGLFSFCCPLIAGYSFSMKRKQQGN